MTELIITEKPAASKKIADALGNPIKESIDGVPFYKITYKNKDIIVGCAVGHLYHLREKQKSWNFPVFDIDWVQIAGFAKKYIAAIKKLSKNAKEFTIATDYDIEGEVIGLNVIRFTCNKKDANRMKFSTLTKDDLIESYNNKSHTLDWGQARAGETRHILDWFYGVNVSRALMSAIKTTGSFRIMSTGRVQGPSLKIIVDKEKEILAFKSKPFWQIELKNEISAFHKTEKFWDKKEAEKIFSKIKNEKKGTIEKVDKKETNVEPPFPFDLTTMQIEAYRCFGISPKETLAIAQELYTNSYISYPRTSSQMLPKGINYSKILEQLKSQKQYADIIKNLKSKILVPHNGKKTDPAHPAIYPTGIMPKKLEQKEQKIYDLIVKRFIATFGDNALREFVSIEINVKQEIFIARGSRTIKQGWFLCYQPYVSFKEEELPGLKQGDIINIKKFILHEKETQPPKRYTPASIIKELEKRNLGTKSTRAQIIDTLYQRNYVDGKSIKATELGIKTIEVLEKYCPAILDEELTRHFEIEMEQVREGTKKEEDVLDEAKGIIKKIASNFKEKEKNIGRGLLDAQKEGYKTASKVGICPKCNGNLVIKKGKFGKFVACSNYPKSKNTFKLPAVGKFIVGEKICDKCKYPMITVIKTKSKPQEVCINTECPSKKVENFKEKQCPGCKEGKLILRTSIYGSFIGCTKYPKCRYTEKIKP